MRSVDCSAVNSPMRASRWPRKSAKRSIGQSTSSAAVTPDGGFTIRARRRAASWSSAGLRRSAIDRLRYHPRCPLGVWRVDEDPRDAWRTAPAMVNPVVDPDGAVRAVQVTYLSPDGRAKAALGRRSDGTERPTRKVYGKVAGNAIWLSDPADMYDTSLPLIVGEGYETTWSYAQDFGKPCRAAAAVSLGNLQGGAVRLRDGSLPLHDIRCDPRQPPFLIRRPGEVIILVDADMKSLKDQRVQLAPGGPQILTSIDGLKRAEICAKLAGQAWRRAGAHPLKIARPAMGFDFNDEAREAA
jgi:hypothetical protein